MVIGTLTSSQLEFKWKTSVNIATDNSKGFVPWASIREFIWANHPTFARKNSAISIST